MLQQENVALIYIYFTIKMIKVRNTTRYSASEAWGYGIRNAVNNGDKEFAQELISSYFSLSLYSTSSFLMGWNVNQQTGAVLKNSVEKNSLK